MDTNASLDKYIFSKKIPNEKDSAQQSRTYSAWEWSRSRAVLELSSFEEVLRMTERRSSKNVL